MSFSSLRFKDVIAGDTKLCTIRGQVGAPSVNFLCDCDPERGISICYLKKSVQNMDRRYGFKVVRMIEEDTASRLTNDPVIESDR